jgi:hypothetical protein
MVKLLVTKDNVKEKIPQKKTINNTPRYFKSKRTEKISIVLDKLSKNNPIITLIKIIAITTDSNEIILDIHNCTLFVLISLILKVSQS